MVHIEGVEEFVKDLEEEARQFEQDGLPLEAAAARQRMELVRGTMSRIGEGPKGDTPQQMETDTQNLKRDAKEVVSIVQEKIKILQQQKEAADMEILALRAQLRLAELRQTKYTTCLWIS